ncbi:hypothetical protein VOLCADRAFT_100802 [Volvox carteri f. nagariensis]|uniref:Uncharacterized protein n=1 Tax=Volvox carteri f. nagariensis TaxID=3068 RepID=D8UL26_VOLCA|nr:uncharacterized protein VOLCADRAFT_100802 [Volvox carteri f. nagariensis]EFJ39575.1 hypothetical protein VOLCADRAFT_100802 [Volvox carteri f. nagariensis]|eukprot:XP_002959359.1 hypothetical protein VOLCADRAFT_100802 [Volvox carteri f. nagariensis]
MSGSLPETGSLTETHHIIPCSGRVLVPPVTLHKIHLFTHATPNISLAYVPIRLLSACGRVRPSPPSPPSHKPRRQRRRQLPYSRQLPCRAAAAGAAAGANNSNNNNNNNNNNDNSNNSIRNHAAAAALNAGGGGVEPSYTPDSSTPRSGSVGNAQRQRRREAAEAKARRRALPLAAATEATEMMKATEAVAAPKRKWSRVLKLPPAAGPPPPPPPPPLPQPPPRLPQHPPGADARGGSAGGSGCGNSGARVLSTVIAGSAGRISGNGIASPYVLRGSMSARLPSPMRPRGDFGSYGSGGGGGGLASGGSFSEGAFASGMIVLGGSGDSAEGSKLPPVSEIPMPYSMLGTYGSGVGSMRGRLVSYSSAGGAATGGTAAVAEGIAGFTAHADDNTIRQSVSQFDSQSQLQLPQQQERTRGSFLLQPNTLVSSSVASSAATSAVVVTIGTNVPSSGVNYGLQSQQPPPPPPPPSRASLAAALAHTGDGSLSATSWLQPPPPVKPPPPSRNSVPQQQRPEQQQMLTQQLSESYGSESAVSTLQNMYGGSTGLRPQLQAGTWGQERSMSTPTPTPTPTPTQQQQQQRQAEVAAAFAAYLSGGTGGEVAKSPKRLTAGGDGTSSLYGGTRVVTAAAPSAADRATGALQGGGGSRLNGCVMERMVSERDAVMSGKPSQRGCLLDFDPASARIWARRPQRQRRREAAEAKARRRALPLAAATEATEMMKATEAVAAPKRKWSRVLKLPPAAGPPPPPPPPPLPQPPPRLPQHPPGADARGGSAGGSGCGNSGARVLSTVIAGSAGRISGNGIASPYVLRGSMSARLPSPMRPRGDFGSYGSGGGGGGLASGGSFSEGAFASGMIVLGGSGDSAEGSKLPPVSEIPMPYSMLGTYGSGVGSMRGRLVCPVVEEDGEGEGEEAGDAPPPPPPPLASTPGDPGVSEPGNAEAAVAAAAAAAVAHMAVELRSGMKGLRGSPSHTASTAAAYGPRTPAAEQRQPPPPSPPPPPPRSASPFRGSPSRDDFMSPFRAVGRSQVRSPPPPAREPDAVVDVYGRAKV